MTIGGTTAAARNVISGNQLDGIHILGAEATGVVVLGNEVGTDGNGSTALGNGDGVVIDGAINDIVGGSAPGAGNLISGNVGTGIKITGASPSAILVQGNRIGTDAAGRTAVGNAVGVYLDGARAITVGGATVGAGNLISGNDQAGVYLFGRETTQDVILGNDIGPDITGLRGLTTPLDPSTGTTRQAIGVFLNDSPGNTVGGLTSGAANVLSGNAVGVSLVELQRFGQLD